MYISCKYNFGASTEPSMKGEPNKTFLFWPYLQTFIPENVAGKRFGFTVALSVNVR